MTADKPSVALVVMVTKALKAPTYRERQDALRAVGAAHREAIKAALDRHGLGVLDGMEVVPMIESGQAAALAAVLRRADVDELAAELAEITAQAQEAHRYVDANMPTLCAGGCGGFFPAKDLTRVDVPIAHGKFCASCRDKVQKEHRRRLAMRSIRSALTRARAAGLPATLTKDEWVETRAFFDDACAYCGGEWYVVEHITLVERGGGTTVGNCVPACYSCNLNKLSFSIDELLKGKRRTHAFEKDRLEKIRRFVAAKGDHVKDVQRSDMISGVGDGGRVRLAEERGDARDGGTAGGHDAVGHAEATQDRVDAPVVDHHETSW